MTDSLNELPQVNRGRASGWEPFRVTSTPSDIERRIRSPSFGSIGFRSGEYGGKKANSAPDNAINSRVRARSWLLRLSIATKSPGRSVGTSTCSTNASKRSLLTAPSTTVKQRTPSAFNAAINAVVFQWPCAILSTSRSPRFERPRSRVMFVLAHVSSMKISRHVAFGLLGDEFGQTRPIDLDGPGSAHLAWRSLAERASALLDASEPSGTDVEDLSDVRRLHTAVACGKHAVSQIL